MSVSGEDVLVQARGLARNFGERRAVDGLDLQIHRGRVLGLLGPNGSGKSTTVRLLTGVLTPSAGSIWLFGEPLNRKNAPELRRAIGVQTEARLYDRLSVAENLKYWGAFFGLSRAHTERRTREVLSIVGLDDRRSDRYGALSKGLRQKAAIARALLHEPQLLFLDEPTAGLDPESSVDLIDHLGQLVAAGDTTVVLATHQLQGLEGLCDDLVVIRNGRLVAAGSVGELVAAQWPRSRHTVVVDSDREQASRELTASGATIVELDGARIVFDIDDEDDIAALVTRLVTSGVAVRSLVPESRSVHELYFRLVGRDAS